MAKKSSAARSSGAGRRPQTTAKNTSRQATLVRAPSATSGPAAGTAETNATQPRQPSVTSAARIATSTPSAAPKVVASAAKPAPRQTAAPATTARAQANRAARAHAVQRARAANLISAENYAYVINDLKLTAVLAGSMFLLIIILHFVLG